MPNISRTDDKWFGICCCHSDPKCISMGGYILTGNEKQTSDGKSVGRVTDMVVGYCGHTGKIVTGSPKNTSDKLAKARVGSFVAGCTRGKIVTGNPKHTVP